MQFISLLRPIAEISLETGNKYDKVQGTGKLKVLWVKSYQFRLDLFLCGHGELLMLIIVNSSEFQ